MNNAFKEIVNNFSINGSIYEITAFGNGHINDTYLVKTSDNDYILQRKNHLVFKDVPAMMDNIVRVSNHIKQKLIQSGISDIERRVFSHLTTQDDKYFYKDSQGNYWTLCKRILNSKSIESIENPHQAWLTGKAFGQFQNQLADLPKPDLNETIIDFHNIEFRYKNFRKAIQYNYNNRLELIKEEVDFALMLEDEMHTLLDAQNAGKIPIRITHNDTKINNVLFDENNNVLCVIDLDTVMPGLIHFDFGDAIRTGASTAAEDENDISKMTIDLQRFEAFAKGYIEETKAVLNDLEIELLPHSAKFMSFIMGLRFLTDFLDGDVYYKIKFADHNLTRARAQFKLVKEIGKNESAMKDIVYKLI